MAQGTFMLNHKATSLLALILLSIFPTVSHASQMNLGDLQDICMTLDPEGKAACKFYIWGVAEGTNIGAGVAKDQNHFCMPEGTSSEKLVFTVKKMIGEDTMIYPKDRELPAVSFVAAALLKSFPCH